MPKPVARSRIPKITSVDALMGLAEERKLPISRDTAKRRFAKSEAGEGFPLEQVVSQMIKEAMHKKRLPEQVKKGRLIPLWEFEARLGLPEHTLYERKDVKKFKIGTTWYVTGREAASLENLKRAIKGKPQEPAREKPQKRQPEKPGVKKPVPEQRPGVKKPAANPETMKLIASWQRSFPLVGSKGKIMLMKRLLLKSRHLTPEQFKREVEPVLARLMQRNQQ